MHIPKKVNHIHMIAICGTGMGSLAGLLVEQGFKVTGTDAHTYPPMSTQLQSLGIELFEGFSPKNLLPKPDLVIIGNAVSKDNPEVVAVLENNIPYLSMPQALSEYFLSDKKPIVIAGTHGKTTTTALLTHLLLHLKADPSYLIGGILPKGQNNYHASEGEYFVIEGDEYDSAFFDKESKFFHYQPYHAILTSIEFDHADIFKDLDHITQAFRKFVGLINSQGSLLACAHYKPIMDIISQCPAKVETYGFKTDATWNITNIQYDQQTTLSISHNGNPEEQLSSPLLGEHNALNTLACYALLRNLGYTHSNIQDALLQFPGVKRRQEIRAEVNGVLVMDDFAHHPTAVKETLQAVKNRYPKHQLWAVFEPRSNSSKRNIFQQNYAQAFDAADHSIIADVFMPEKVKDGQVLNIDLLAKEITARGHLARHISGTDKIISTLVKEVTSPAVILVMSNGGFDGLHDKLIAALKEKATSVS